MKPAKRVRSKCLKCGYKGDRFAATRPGRCLDCLASDQRAYRKKRREREPTYWPNKDRQYALKKRYGLSAEAFERLLDKQGYKCAICGLDPTTRKKSAFNRRRLHVDHDHATREVRGLLCNGCNRAIGLLNESSDRARRLADYLDSF